MLRLRAAAPLVYILCEYIGNCNLLHCFFFHKSPIISVKSPEKRKCISTGESVRATASSKAAHAFPASPAHEDVDKSISTAKIHELLQKLSDEQAKHFADIRKEVSETRRAVEAIAGKIADMLTRITSTEVHLDMLEEVERQCCVSPPALEVEKLNGKLTEYEDRERRVNLRIYGFPERVEDKDAISFLRVTLPEILQADFQGGLDQ